MIDFSELYEHFSARLDEASSDFKGKLLNSKKTKAFFHWEWKLKPALVDIDFGYKITFNKKKIEENFALENGKIDWTDFHNSIMKPNLSERAIKTLAKQVPIPGFSVEFVTYNSEFDIRSLDPNRKDKYHFSHTVTLEAKDDSKDYNRKEMIDMCQTFVNKFEKIGFKDTEYYKITKK